MYRCQKSDVVDFLGFISVILTIPIIFMVGFSGAHVKNKNCEIYPVKVTSSWYDQIDEEVWIEYISSNTTISTTYSGDDYKIVDGKPVFGIDPITHLCVGSRTTFPFEAERDLKKRDTLLLVSIIFGIIVFLNAIISIALSPFMPWKEAFRWKNVPSGTRNRIMLIYGHFLSIITSAVALITLIIGCINLDNNSKYDLHDCQVLGHTQYKIPRHSLKVNAIIDDITYDYRYVGSYDTIEDNTYLMVDIDTDSKCATYKSELQFEYDYEKEYNEAVIIIVVSVFWICMCASVGALYMRKKHIYGRAQEVEMSSNRVIVVEQA